MKTFEPNLLDYDSFSKKEFELNQHYLVSKSLSSNVNFDFFFCSREGAKRTVILFPSAQPAGDIKQQVFHRWSWAEVFKEYNVVSISDPALYLASLSGTWFQSPDGTLISSISSTLTEMLSVLNTDASNTLLYGSSMGGFGALMCGSMLKGAMVAAEVPQIDLEIYPHKSAISQIIDKIYGGDKDAFYSETNRENIDVLTCIKKQEYIPRFCIITNPSDEAFDRHAQFVQNVSNIDTFDVPKDYLLLVNNDVSGHKPLPTSVAVQYVNQVFEFFSGKEKRIERHEPAKKDPTLSDYRPILDRAVKIASDIKYVRDKEDTQRYLKAVELLELSAQANPAADWPFLKICQIEKVWSNSFNGKIFTASKNALSRRKSLEGFIYFCRGALYNCTLDESTALIENMMAGIEDTDITSVGYIFLAIIEYEKGSYDSYEKLISQYGEIKAKDEPYIAIPVSTVYLPQTEKIDPDHNLASMSFVGDLSVLDDVEYIVSVSCDVGYFYKFAEFFVRSFHMNCSENSLLVINILGERDPDIISKVSEWASHSVALNFVDIATGENKEPTASLVRYLCVSELLNTYSLPVLTLDIDCVIKKNFHEMICQYKGNDLCSRILGKNVAPWEKYTGGFTLFYPTENTKKVAQGIIDSAAHVWTDKKKQWWIDQNCIEAGIRSVIRLEGNSLKVVNVFQFRDAYCDMPVGPANAKLAFLENSFKSISNQAKLDES